jgi:hypothetical protein
VRVAIQWYKVSITQSDSHWQFQFQVAIDNQRHTTHIITENDAVRGFCILYFVLALGAGCPAVAHRCCVLLSCSCGST